MLVKRNSAGLPAVGYDLRPRARRILPRYSRRPVFQHTHNFLYADDIEGAMADLLHSLSLIIVRGFCHWSRASRLRLKHGKCVVIPLSEGDTSARCALLNSLLGSDLAAVHTSARY